MFNPLSRLNPFKKKKEGEQTKEGAPIAKIDVFSNEQDLEIQVRGKEKVTTSFKEPDAKGLESNVSEDITSSKLRTMVLTPPKDDEQRERWSIIVRPHQFLIAAASTLDDIRKAGDDRQGEAYKSVTYIFLKHFLNLSPAVKGNESELVKAALKIHEDMVEQPQSSGTRMRMG